MREFNTKTNDCLYYTNLTCTLIFICAHIPMMGALYDVWYRGDWLVIVWSAIQVFLAIYSLILLFGSIALQIVFLYLRGFIRMLCFVFLTISTFTMVISMTYYFIE